MLSDKKVSLLAVNGLTILIAFVSVLVSCGDRTSNGAADGGGIEISSDSLSRQFPHLIDGGKKVVYQFAKMTPRGLKYFLDTVDYQKNRQGIDSLNASRLFPLSLSAQQRADVPVIIAVSLPGYWEEMVFGQIDDEGRLWINYEEKQLQLRTTKQLRFEPGGWSGSFENDSIRVDLSANLSDTGTGDFLGGKGALLLRTPGREAERVEIFLAYNKGKDFRNE